jgi:hypothetical protein
MSDEIENVSAEAPVAETPVVETPAPTFEETMDRVAREVIEREPVKGPDGRFQSKVAAPPGAPEGLEVPGSPTAAAPEPVQPAIEAPRSLPDDVKKAWPTLPRAIQEVWSKREGEAHDKITADGEKIKALSSFEEALAPFQARLQQVQAPPAEYVRRLAQADQMLASNPVQGIQEVARLYGIDLRQAVTGQPDPSSALHSKIHELETRLSEREKADEQARLNDANQRIENFRKDRPHFDEAMDMMEKLIRSGAAKDLPDAYDMAINAHPEIRAKRDAEAKAEAEKKAAEEAKAKAARDAKINPLARRPGSTPTAPIKGKSIWETIDHVAEDIRARA